jgi:hypothetical protein
MRLMGWTDRSMLDRYGADMQVQRAIDAKRRRGDLYRRGPEPGAGIITHSISDATAASDHELAHNNGRSVDSASQQLRPDEGPDRSRPSADQAGDRHGPAADDAADRSVAVPRSRMTVRPWPLLILAEPAWRCGPAGSA